MFRCFIFHLVCWSLIEDGNDDGDEFEKHAISLHSLHLVKWIDVCANRILKLSIARMHTSCVKRVTRSNLDHHNTLYAFAISFGFFHVQNAGHAIDRSQPINEMNARIRLSVAASRESLNWPNMESHIRCARRRFHFIHVYGEKLFSLFFLLLFIRCVYSMSATCVVCAAVTRRYIRIALEWVFPFWYTPTASVALVNAQHFWC